MVDWDVAEIEQTKLLANAFDRASTACFTVGVLTPLAGFAYGVASFASISAGSQVIVVLAGWLISAAILHYMARRTLRGLA
jgi:hypothetical protein